MTEPLHEWKYKVNQLGQPTYSLVVNDWPISVGGVVDYDPSKPRWKVVKKYDLFAADKWFDLLPDAQRYLLSQWLLFKLTHKNK